MNMCDAVTYAYNLAIFDCAAFLAADPPWADVASTCVTRKGVSNSYIACHWFPPDWTMGVASHRQVFCFLLSLVVRPRASFVEGTSARLYCSPDS